MKEKIIMQFKKVMAPIVLSVICGFLCGSVVYNIYKEKTSYELQSSKVYLIQAGAYSSYDNMKVNTMANNYVYYEDDGMYKAIIAIVKNKDNIDKIKNIYNGEVVVNEYVLNDKEIDKRLSELDNTLTKESDETKVREIVNNMLSIYKENENVKLMKTN